MKDLPNNSDFIWLRRGDAIAVPRNGHIVIGNTRLPLLHSIVALLGLERALMVLCDKPEWVRETVAMLTERQLENIQHFATQGCNAIHWCDDIGTQEGPLIDPALWLDLFGPAYRQCYALAHERGMKTILHSCGKITAFLPILKDVGLDVIQTDQPALVGLTALEMSGLTVFAPVDLDVLAKDTPAKVSHIAFSLMRLSRFWPKAPWGIDVKFPQENMDAMNKEFAA